jgi:hypothetical protein
MSSSLVRNLAVLGLALAASPAIARTAEAKITPSQRTEAATRLFEQVLDQQVKKQGFPHLSENQKRAWIATSLGLVRDDLDKIGKMSGTITGYDNYVIALNPKTGEKRQIGFTNVTEASMFPSSSWLPVEAIKSGYKGADLFKSQP